MSTAKLPYHVVPAVALTALWFFLGTADAADWKPAEGPLATRWAKDVKPDNVLPEYPRPQMRRDAWLNLNGVWQLAVAKENDAPPTGKELDDRILVPFPVESALSGVMKHADRLWYRRTFALPKDWADKRVLLHFGAVDWQATVWVNGKKLEEHKGGYDAFTVDITEAVDPKKADQELIVGVWDPTDAGTQPRGKQVAKPGGIFYTPVTGIWQTVWLEPVNRAGHIESLKITPNLDKEEVAITVKVNQTLGNTSTSIEVRDGDEVVAKASGLDDFYTLKIPKPKLWSPESPTLYTVRVSVSGMKLESGSDSVETYFGMRQIGIGKDDKGVTRILLNGKPIFLRGPLDQGFWPDGIYTAPTDEALKYDIEITKKLGFNMTRKHVKVEPDRWYYWCDKLGLLVYQDMPSGDKSIGPGKPDIVRTPESAKQYDLELKRMVDGLYNHPSIMAWVVFNEGWGQFDTARVADWTKLYDPSRLVDSASGWQDRKVGDVFDIHVYPGPGCPDSDGKRALMLGEFGGLGLQIEGHTWENKIWGYRGVKDKEDLTRKYEKLWQETYRLKNDKGLSAAVYTQLTDVETEGNGLLTYDRAVIKPDLARVAAAAGGDFSRVPQDVPILPTSLEKAQVWRYTFDKPADGWMKPDFKDAEWKQGEGAFGANLPGAPIRTQWKSDDIWIRREATLPNNAFADPYLTMFHDEDAEVYFDGVAAAKVAGYNTGYDESPITPEALALLKPGKKIVIAVHCHQTEGGQFIDVGLTAVKPAAPAFHNDYFGKMPRAWVEILKIDPEGRVLTVRTKKGEEREVRLRGDTEMRVRDGWGDLTDLYPGESVMLFVYHDDAGEWAYPRAVQDEIQMMSFHKWWWTVDALDAKAGTVALSRKDDKGKTVQETFRVGDATKVWKGEKPSGLDALKVGDVVLFQTRYETGQKERFAVELMDEKGLEAIRAEQKAKHDKELAENGLPAVINNIDVLTGAVHATVQWEAGEEARALKPGTPVDLVRLKGKERARKFTAVLVEGKADGARQQLLLAADPAFASTIHIGDEVRVFPPAGK